MKVLVIGSGGREHSLIWKIAHSKRVSKIYSAPGNAGIAKQAECVGIGTDDIDGLLDFARANSIDLTIVGPEAPLAAGIVDSFKRVGLRIFGPTKEASVLEGSKVFCKDFCRRYGIPSAQFETFGNAELAKAYIHERGVPIVVKVDGLAAGKGVFICKTLEDAQHAVDDILVLRKFGDAGTRIVVEEFLEGEEASFIAICDGNHVLPLASSQDHKAVFDGDNGPNTGGMGAISPARIVTNGVATKIMDKIMLPAARGMVTEGMPFVGVLYAGLMIKDGRPIVLEFNVRFGDPETQVLMMRLKTDIVDIIEAAVEGALNQITLEWDPKPSACVIMAAGGYPESYEKGKTIHGLDAVSEMSDVVIFHAGTKYLGDEVITDGGRVLGVTALGHDMAGAIRRTYEAVEKISWDGVHYRKDIGWRAL